MKTKSIARIALLSAIMCRAAGAWANSYTIVDLGGYLYPAAVNESREVPANGVNQRGIQRAQEFRKDRWHKLSPGSGGHALNTSGDAVCLA